MTSLPSPEDAASVARVYRRLAPIYDLIYGVTLEAGRRRALARLAPARGELILEIGVGTGLSAVQYPPSCRVVAIDLSAEMLERAQARRTRRQLHHVHLCQMDAGALGFRDGQFDAVYAPYVMNVVDDPVRVARELTRVAKRDARLVFLNHFGGSGESRVNRVLGCLAARAGVNWQIRLATLLHDAGLTAESVERVNLPQVSSVVVCRRRSHA